MLSSHLILLEVMKEPKLWSRRAMTFLSKYIIITNLLNYPLLKYFRFLKDYK